MNSAEAKDTHTLSDNIIGFEEIINLSKNPNDPPAVTEQQLKKMTGQNHVPVLIKTDQNPPQFITYFPIKNKPGKAHKVVSHLAPDDKNRGCVNVFIKGVGLRALPVIISWEHHGKPCQNSSVKEGGEKYSLVEFSQFD